MYTLNELADEIISGVVISRIETEEEKSGVGKGTVLTLRAINQGVIDEEELSEIQMIKTTEKISQKGDIVMKMNRPYDSVFIESKYEGYIIPSFCCKISGIKTNLVDPYYLVGFLNSNVAKEYLRIANGASSAALLKIGDIKKLPVSLPIMAEQKAIGEIFKVCCERKVILRNMMEHEMRMAESIILDAAREAMADEKE